MVIDYKIITTSKHKRYILKVKETLDIVLEYVIDELLKHTYMSFNEFISRLKKILDGLPVSLEPIQLERENVILKYGESRYANPQTTIEFNIVEEWRDLQLNKILD